MQFSIIRVCFCENWLVSKQAINPQSRHACFMLTELYIEALLVDKDLADQVWELWDAEVITDGLAAWA